MHVYISSEHSAKKKYIMEAGKKTSVVTNPKMPPTEELRMIRTFCLPSQLINSPSANILLPDH